MLTLRRDRPFSSRSVKLAVFMANAFFNASTSPASMISKTSESLGTIAWYVSFIGRFQSGLKSKLTQAILFVLDLVNNVILARSGEVKHLVFLALFSSSTSVLADQNDSSIRPCCVCQAVNLKSRFARLRGLV
jgi:hypothetical protein